jgi:hypothetical protein
MFKKNKSIKKIITMIMGVMMVVSFGAVSVSATSVSLPAVQITGNGSHETTRRTLPDKNITVNSKVNIIKDGGKAVNEKVTVEFRRSRWYGSDLLTSGSTTMHTNKKTTPTSITSSVKAPLNTNGYFCTCIVSGSNNKHSTKFSVNYSYK